MVWDRVRETGKVTVRVLDEKGRIKREAPKGIGKLLRRPGRERIGSHHNIVTTGGDTLLADRISGANALTMVDNSHGHIEVGTGWTNVSPKGNTACNTATGTRQVMDTGYPKVKAGESNVVVYRATFPVGNLNATGLDEAALMNSLTGGECLAYAQITPPVNITEYDTLQIEWEITFLGS